MNMNMNINATQTIKFVNPMVETKIITNSTIQDPERQISNGIYKVISWERIRQIAILFTSLAGLLASIILIALYATVWNGSWGTFILPTLLGLLSSFKVMITYIEFKALRNAVKRYREDLKIGLDSMPPFIPKLYMNMQQKQVKHNWLTFFIIFYFGIFTLALWWLKDTSFWIFEFDKWIKGLFGNPDLMVILFTIGLLLTVVMYIFMTIQRKKRIIEVEAFYGSQVIQTSELTDIKMKMNKFYRRMFIISVMGILVIPLVVKAVLRILKK